MFLQIVRILDGRRRPAFKELAESGSVVTHQCSLRL
jgi:hypothetical protein